MYVCMRAIDEEIRSALSAQSYEEGFDCARAVFCMYVYAYVCLYVNMYVWN